MPDKEYGTIAAYMPAELLSIADARKNGVTKLCLDEWISATDHIELDPAAPSELYVTPMGFVGFGAKAMFVSSEFGKRVIDIGDIHWKRWRPYHE
jgi:hypothetical protein